MEIACAGIIKSGVIEENIMKNVLWIAIAAVIFAGYTWFGKIQDEVIVFNDNLIDLLEQEEKSFTNYIDYLEKYYMHEVIDVEQMNIALNALATNHASISGHIKQMDVPNYEVCRTFHTTVVNFLDNDARIITIYADVSKYIESNNPGTEPDIDEISVMLDPLLELNDSIFNEIIIAQKNMSDKFRFKLE